ncbi:MAG: ferredoxin family protein [Candidatus Omnitrophota bacterium]|nr:ferredoxin family protein [Candidatus Omnitrophota bacterium]
MSYVINDKCLGERYASCVAVCPVDCIYPGEYQEKPFMVIDPEVCISCGACEPECPIGAIVAEEDMAPDYAVINAELSPKWKDNPKVEERPKDDPPHRPENKLIQ